MFAEWKRCRASERVEIPPIPELQDNAVLEQVDGQIRWYDDNGRRARAWHFWLRGVQIFFAAAVPVTQIPPAAIGWRLAAGVLGGLIAICQGIDTMHHFGEHYVAWRGTCQALLRERQLFAAGADEYDGLDTAKALKQLVSRCAAVENQEQQKWAAGQLKGSGGAGSSQA